MTSTFYSNDIYSGLKHKVSARPRSKEVEEEGTARGKEGIQFATFSSLTSETKTQNEFENKRSVESKVSLMRQRHVAHRIAPRFLFHGYHTTPEEECVAPLGNKFNPFWSEDSLHALSSCPGRQSLE